VQNSARPSAVSAKQSLRYRSVNDEHPSILGKLFNLVELRFSFCSAAGGFAQNSARPSAVSFLHESSFRSVNAEHPSILGKPVMAVLARLSSFNFCSLLISSGIVFSDLHL